MPPLRVSDYPIRLPTNPTGQSVGGGARPPGLPTVLNGGALRERPRERLGSRNRRRDQLVPGPVVGLVLKVGPDGNRTPGGAVGPLGGGVLPKARPGAE